MTPSPDVAALEAVIDELAKRTPAVLHGTAFGNPTKVIGEDECELICAAIPALIAENREMRVMRDKILKDNNLEVAMRKDAEDERDHLRALLADVGEFIDTLSAYNDGPWSAKTAALLPRIEEALR